MDTDRPPIAGVVGRESGEVRLDVIETASMVELDDVVDDACLEGTTVNTDEWNGYNRIGKRHGRVHPTVDHSGPKRTWARDLDGDGVREVQGEKRGQGKNGDIAGEKRGHKGKNGGKNGDIGGKTGT